MYIFIISLVFVSFVSYCFLKKDFWKNRFLVLLIGAGVALIVTLATNYWMRSNLPVKVKIIWNKPLESYNVIDSMFIDSVPLIKNKYIGDKIPLSKNIDSIQIRKINIFFGRKYVYYRINDDFENDLVEDIYIAPSKSDTIMYLEKRRLYYDRKSSNWITNFSLPSIKTIRCLYIPPTEYSTIPDSLINKIPF